MTVSVVLEYLQAGRDRNWIARNLRLTSPQVQAAIDYIESHREEVEAAYAKARQRIEQGNPAWVEERLQENRPRFEAFVQKCGGRNGYPRVFTQCREMP